MVRVSKRKPYTAAPAASGPRRDGGRPSNEGWRLRSFLIPNRRKPTANRVRGSMAHLRGGKPGGYEAN
eukprot:scaffold110692_cov21-Phaeocystis_antarctica.AAC.1